MARPPREEKGLSQSPTKLRDTELKFLLSCMLVPEGSSGPAFFPTLETLMHSEGQVCFAADRWEYGGQI